jgi:hypothetical protein
VPMVTVWLDPEFIGSIKPSLLVAVRLVDSVGASKLQEPLPTVLKQLVLVGVPIVHDSVSVVVTACAPGPKHSAPAIRAVVVHSRLIGGIL